MSIETKEEKRQIIYKPGIPKYLFPYTVLFSLQLINTIENRFNTSLTIFLYNFFQTNQNFKKYIKNTKTNTIIIVSGKCILPNYPSIFSLSQLLIIPCSSLCQQNSKMNTNLPSCSDQVCLFS